MVGQRTIIERCCALGRIAFSTLGIVLLLLPFIWLAISALRPSAEFLGPPVHFVPTRISFASVIRFWETFSDTESFFWISVGVSAACATTATLLGFGIGMGYISAARNERLLRHLCNAMLAARFLPPVVGVAGFFMVFSWLGLLDTKLALVVVNILPNTGLAVLFLVPAFRAIPRDFIEQARIEGTTRGTLFAAEVVFPVVRAPLLAVWMLAFASTWNEYLLASMVTETARSQPLAVYVATGIGQYRVDFSFLSLAALISLLPAAIIAPIVGLRILQRRGRRTNSGYPEPQDGT